MPDAPAAQTLARGLRILDLLAEAPAPMSIGQVAAALAVHRSVAYRLVRTLEDSNLVVRDATGSLVLGSHIVTLARSVAPNLQSAAQPVLQGLADDLHMTAFLAVLDRDECVTLLTIEPRTAVAAIAQRPGSRHSVLRGAPGLAIQTLLGREERAAIGLTEVEDEDVTAARRAGFAVSRGEVLPGVSAVAAPVVGAVRAAIAVLFVSHDDPGSIGEQVSAAALRMARFTR